MASEPQTAASSSTLFRDLPLPDAIQRAVSDRGYTEATPIQAAIIPAVLAGDDVIGQAQTGTGKTAAFALPLLARINPKQNGPQVLVLAPTRELAGQVAEACSAYGQHMKGMKIAAIYGGAGYGEQLANLRRGAQVIVGTPGRVIDHMKKGSLDVSNLQCLVLDEADEMLRMGFIEDVEWVLAQTPESRQVALFSATMPKQIRQIAQRYLSQPTEINIKAATETASTVRARYWYVRGVNKFDACARIIEGEETDGVIVFTRTKHGSEELADGLKARGISASALNGDMAQAQRERVVNAMKNNNLDVIVATDVAARGIDIARISHVINFDVPENAETYVHRIGRTGRAGRSGDAILFVSPRDKRTLRDIERRTKQHLEEMVLPSVKDINNKRIASFAKQIIDTANGPLDEFEDIIKNILAENDVDPVRIAAALAKIGQAGRPLLLQPERPQKISKHGDNERSRDHKHIQHGSPFDSEGSDYYRLDVGKKHGTRPGMIVGAIANELDIPGSAIGHIQIHHAYSTVALPHNLPAEVKQALRSIYVSQRPLKAELLEDAPQHHKPESRSSGGLKKKRDDKKPFAKAHKKGKTKQRRAIERRRQEEGFNPAAKPGKKGKRNKYKNA